MAKASLKKISAMVAETLAALEALGIPMHGLSVRRREKMAKAVLALADLKPGMSWDQLKSSAEEHHLRSREVIAFLNAHWGEQIADSSYDDIRRKDLAFPVEARLVIKSASNPDANTNDGTRGFAIDPAAAKVLRSIGTARWAALLREYLNHRPALSLQFDRQRNLARVPVLMPSGLLLSLSAGAHNNLQKDILEKFLPIFGFESEVLYTADVILITAFPDRATYRKFAHEIAWETEVWIADAPEHMIHFNGDKFLGPYRPVV